MTTIDALYLVLGILLGYFVSYFQQKGKNAALLSDIKKLEGEKEEVKRGFTLDIEKRKYKYESKSQQYFKYFNLLDDFNAKSAKETRELFIPVVDEFNRNYLGSNGNKNVEHKAITVFSAKVNKLLSKSGEDMTRIKNETGTIKLIAGTEVLKQLNLLQKLYDESFDRSSGMMRELGNHIILGKSEKLKQEEAELTRLGELILHARDRLIQEVKKELDEI